MTLYKESMRRLFRPGLVLMLLSVTATLAYTFLTYGGPAALWLPSALDMAPVLAVYAFVGGIMMAFFGFSFQNGRAGSDFYHSIPIKRIDIYASITAAAATWMLATVVVSTLASTLVYLLTKTPFVPLYPLMDAGFFFTAALLVFAAAAIGCALTGTWFSNIVVTCIVLLLPRYLLYQFDMRIISDTGVMDLLDFTWLLNPRTNAATSLAVALLEYDHFASNLVSLGGILWSLFVAVLELGIGALLFTRRPSELAGHGAKTQRQQAIFACLVVLPLLLLYVSTGVMEIPGRIAVIEMAVVIAVALVCYAIYQLIILRNFKRMFRSLPWFLCALAMSAVAVVAGEALFRRVMNDIPAADDIAYVRFLGADRANYVQSYASIAVSEIRFSETEVLELVSHTLQKNLTDDEKANKGPFASSEPVQIVLKSGRRLNRQLLFPDLLALQACLSQNEAYSQASWELPPAEAPCIVASLITETQVEGEDPNTNTAELKVVWAQYVDEQRASPSFTPYRQYDPKEYDSLFYTAMSDTPYLPTERQKYGFLEVWGHIGAKRYRDSFSITLAAPKTASRLMVLKNRYATNAPAEAYSAYHQAKALDADTEYYYFNMSLEIHNYPKLWGERSTATYTWTITSNSKEDTLWQKYPRFVPLFEELIAILRRGEPTDDPTTLNVRQTHTFHGAEYSDAAPGEDLI